jgi:hypothetical protein
MPKPLVVSIPHRLGKEEAARRLKTGLGKAQTHYSHLFSVQQEVWTGDRLQFHITALGQAASGLIDVRDDDVLLEITLPWLLHKLAEKLAPAIRKEGVLLLEKK